MDDSAREIKTAFAPLGPGQAPLSKEEQQSRYERLYLLYQVSNIIHSTLDPHEALQLILREAVRLMRATSGSVVLVNPTSGFLEIQASYGLPPNTEELKLRVGEGITGWVARHGKAARVGDVSRDKRYIMVKQNICSELAVPLDVNGKTSGVINVDSDRADAFSPADEELLQELAMQASRVIQNTWVYEQIRLKAGLFESLVRVGQTINSALSLDDALTVITREAAALMNAKMCSLLMLDESREWLELRASYGAGEAYINKPRLFIAESLLGTVVRRKKPMQVENVQISARYQSVEVARQEGLVSLLSVPLIYREKAIGTLSVYTSNLHNFSNEEIMILSGLAELSAIAIQKARLYERVVDIEEQLRQNEKLSAIGLLAAEVAHEIRNPLTVMKMLYHSLNLDFPASDPRSKDVIIMGQKMDHLNKIVEQVLDLARNTEPTLTSISLNQVIDDLTLLTRHKLNHQDIELKLQLAPDLPPILGDSTQLEQAFLNLTLNAVEAMPKGGVLTIKTSLLQTPKKETPPRIKIEFQDTGKGMTDDQCNRLFSSLLSTTKEKGTGLGMAIILRIVEAHQGTIAARSKPGKGTTISIEIPVDQ